jgi:hypothetical protein
MVFGPSSPALAQEPLRPDERTPAAAAAEDAEPVVGQLEHSGWMLSGDRGRHYVFGGLAVADYAGEDRRQIVTLQQEEPSLLPKPDDKFLYYRELGTGRRWAIGRYPLADDSYAVYFQPPAETEAEGKWMLFHRARLIWPEKQGAAANSHPQTPQMTQKKSRDCVASP